MLVRAGAWPPVRSSCGQPGAAPNGLPGDLCSDSRALNSSLQLLAPPAGLSSSQSNGGGCSHRHREVAGSFFCPHQVFAMVLEGCGTHCLGGADKALG